MDLSDCYHRLEDQFSNFASLFVFHLEVLTYLNCFES